MKLSRTRRWGASSHIFTIARKIRQFLVTDIARLCLQLLFAISTFLLHQRSATFWLVRSIPSKSQWLRVVHVVSRGCSIKESSICAGLLDFSVLIIK